MRSHISRLNVELDLAELHHHHPDRYPFLLASTADSLSAARSNNRYDILFAFPGDSLRLDHRLQLHADSIATEGNDFLFNFDRWFELERRAASDVDLPFAGGWFIYLSYELASQIEPVLELPLPQQYATVACAVRMPAAIIYDHQDNEYLLVAEDGREELIDQMKQDCLNVPATREERPCLAETVIEQDSAIYFDQVDKIKRYIYDGDIFQANLSRHWDLVLHDQVEDRDLFHHLSRSNPASFACLVKLGNTSIIGSSPERLARIRGNIVDTRPIAGTRPREQDTIKDQGMSATLMSHPKERAEHIMLIDLERNDLGRVCVPGSVEVDELLTLESWQHVHHIVSNVRGELRSNVLPGEIIRAVFPGGTITGCPKVRCMQILAELEAEPRGAYTGSVGYIGLDGRMDTNILIRSMTRQGKRIRFRAGGGIVADSDPQMELEETRAKARGLLDIFELESSAEESGA